MCTIRECHFSRLQFFLHHKAKSIGLICQIFCLKGLVCRLPHLELIAYLKNELRLESVQYQKFGHKLTKEGLRPQ